MAGDRDHGGAVVGAHVQRARRRQTRGEGEVAGVARVLFGVEVGQGVAPSFLRPFRYGACLTSPMMSS